MPDSVSEIANPEQWLFLDTETTGLAGGSGTYAFLIWAAESKPTTVSTCPAP
jgi:uncharacterized protein YprB with RNaseH-like and TPR domain